MRVHHLTENVEFDLKHTSRGYHHGQYDLAVVAYSGDEIAGWIDYSVYDGEASIQMIEVKPEYARRGLAKQMLLALQDKYPDQEIDWGSLTRDGSKLYQSMKWKKIKASSLFWKHMGIKSVFIWTEATVMVSMFSKS